MPENGIMQWLVRAASAAGYLKDGGCARPSADSLRASVVAAADSPGCLRVLQNPKDPSGPLMIRKDTFGSRRIPQNPESHRAPQYKFGFQKNVQILGYGRIPLDSSGFLGIP